MAMHQFCNLENTVRFRMSAPNKNTMKDDNYIRQKIIDLYFNKHIPISIIKDQVGKSESFVERVIIKHSDFIRK